MSEEFMVCYHCQRDGFRVVMNVCPDCYNSLIAKLEALTSELAAAKEELNECYRATSSERPINMTITVNKLMLGKLLQLQSTVKSLRGVLEKTKTMDETYCDDCKKINNCHKYSVAECIVELAEQALKETNNETKSI